MDDYIEVAGTGELTDGAMKKVKAGDAELLLARAAGKFYCVQALCPHMGGDLSQGKLDGTVVECPLHHSRFDLADGHVIRWGGKIGGPKPLKTHEVRVDGDRVLVRP